MSIQQRSEDVLGTKIDHCMADALLKTLGGAAIGTITSIFIFKAKRTWPIWFGTGIGIGMGWSNCRHELKNTNLLYETKINVAKNHDEPSNQDILQQQTKQ